MALLFYCPLSVRLPACLNRTPCFIPPGKSAYRRMADPEVPGNTALTLPCCQTLRDLMLNGWGIESRFPHEKHLEFSKRLEKVLTFCVLSGKGFLFHTGEDETGPLSPPRFLRPFCDHNHQNQREKRRNMIKSHPRFFFIFIGHFLSCY
jgi:hypothetical protein